MKGVVDFIMICKLKLASCIFLLCSAVIAGESESYAQIQLRAALNAKDVDGVRAAMKAGADPNYRDPRHGNDPALHRELKVATQERTLEIVKALIAGGADVNQRNDDGCIPLHYTCRGHTYSFAEALLDAGADPLIQDRNKRTPIHLVAMNDLVPGMLQLMLKAALKKRPAPVQAARGRTSGSYGHILNMKDKYGETCLHLAVKFAGTSVEPIEWMLQNGADPYVKNDNGKIPLDVAKRKSIRDILKKYMLVGNSNARQRQPLKSRVKSFRRSR